MARRDADDRTVSELIKFQDALERLGLLWTPLDSLDTYQAHELVRNLHVSRETQPFRKSRRATQGVSVATLCLGKTFDLLRNCPPGDVVSDTANAEVLKCSRFSAETSWLLVHARVCRSISFPRSRALLHAYCCMKNRMTPRPFSFLWFWHPVYYVSTHRSTKLALVQPPIDPTTRMKSLQTGLLFSSVLSARAYHTGRHGVLETLTSDEILRCAEGNGSADRQRTGQRRSRGEPNRILCAVSVILS